MRKRDRKKGLNVRAGSSWDTLALTLDVYYDRKTATVPRRLVLNFALGPWYLQIQWITDSGAYVFTEPNG